MNSKLEAKVSKEEIKAMLSYFKKAKRPDPNG
jgi:hypothetical protein